MSLEFNGDDDEVLPEGEVLIANEALGKLEMPIKDRSYYEREIIAMGFEKDEEHGNMVFFVREEDGCDIACTKNGKVFNVFRLDKK